MSPVPYRSWWDGPPKLRYRSLLPRRYSYSSISFVVAKMFTRIQIHQDSSMVMTSEPMKKRSSATNFPPKRSFQDFEMFRLASCELNYPHFSLCFIERNWIPLFFIIKNRNR